MTDQIITRQTTEEKIEAILIMRGLRTTTDEQAILPATEAESTNDAEPVTGATVSPERLDWFTQTELHRLGLWRKKEG